MIPHARPAHRAGPPCQSCTHPVRWSDDWPPPVCCGRLLCRARLTWTADRWTNAARPAAARHRLGLPLTALDQIALDHQEDPH